ncbi:hypothetical protein BJV74DRAFT_817794 [Russula compacta]|nr:hypothetical protein BJV74DRAFT_817794 [Russula compacta]
MEDARTRSNLKPWLRRVLFFRQLRSSIHIHPLAVVSPLSMATEHAFMEPSADPSRLRLDESVASVRRRQ